MDGREEEEEEEGRDLGRGVRTYLEAKVECKCSPLSSIAPLITIFVKPDKRAGERDYI